MADVSEKWARIQRLRDERPALLANMASGNSYAAHHADLATSSIASVARSQQAISVELGRMAKRAKLALATLPVGACAAQRAAVRDIVQSVQYVQQQAGTLAHSSAPHLSQARQSLELVSSYGKLVNSTEWDDKIAAELIYKQHPPSM